MINHYVIPETTSETDLAWLVGIIEGEGCFSIRINKHKTKEFGVRVRFSPQLGVCNTQKPLIDEVRRIVGYGRVFVDRENIDDIQPRWNWYITSCGLRILLPRLSSYWRCKGEQASLVLQTCDITERNKHKGRIDGKKGKQPLTLEDLQEIDKLRMRLVELHGRQSKKLIKLRAEDYHSIKTESEYVDDCYIKEVIRRIDVAHITDRGKKICDRWINSSD